MGRRLYKKRAGVGKVNPYVPLLVMIIAAVFLAVAGIVLSEILGKITAGRYNRVKNLSYECGIEPSPEAEGSGRFPLK